MSVIIPERTYEKLRAAKPAHHQLATAVARNKNTWSPGQQEQLSLMYQVIKETHDALVNLVEANTPK